MLATGDLHKTPKGAIFTSDEYQAQSKTHTASQ